MSTQDQGEFYVLSLQVANTPEFRGKLGFPYKDGENMVFEQKDLESLNDYLSYIVAWMRARRVIKDQNNPVFLESEQDGIYTKSGQIDDLGLTEFVITAGLNEYWEKFRWT